jgi:hypothetical protein
LICFDIASSFHQKNRMWLITSFAALIIDAAGFASRAEPDFDVRDCPTLKGRAGGDKGG